MSKFMLFDEHIGKKIYEIEEERHIIIKTRVVAKELNLLRDDFSERPEPEEVLEEERQKKLAQQAKGNSFANMSENKSKCL